MTEVCWWHIEQVFLAKNCSLLLHNEHSSEYLDGRVNDCRNPHSALALAVEDPCSHNFKMYEVTKCFEAFTVVIKANTLLLNNLFHKESPQSAFTSA